MASIVTPSNLGPEFLIGTGVATDKIEINVDGTSIQRNAATGALSSTPPTYNNTTKVITFPAQDGAAAFTIDLSSLTTDIFVDGASLNATTNLLTLTDNDATTPDVTVDLSKFTGVSTDVGNIIVDGTDDKPLLTAASVQAVNGVSATAGNLLTVDGTDNLHFLDASAIDAVAVQHVDTFGVNLLKSIS